jgi:hydroxymethylbilane synthase
MTARSTNLLTLATRRSALALTQSRAFAAALSHVHAGLVVNELLIVTAGDRIQNRPLQDLGGKGLFIKELEEALLDKRADFAVHSIKDVPAELPPSLTLACIPLREDPRDVLVSREGAPLAALPEGAIVGTSSLRRMVALHAARPDLHVIAMRGNVDTRLRKLRSGEVDAIVLARAGMKRLGRDAEATEVIAVEVSLPAVGQGALGIECRADDRAVIDALVALVDDETTICVTAERAVMAAVDGSCKTPVAAYAVRDRRDGSDGETLWLRAMLADPDGSRVRHGERRMAYPHDPREAERLGLELGRALKLR